MELFHNIYFVVGSVTLAVASVIYSLVIMKNRRC